MYNLNLSTNRTLATEPTITFKIQTESAEEFDIVFTDLFELMNKYGHEFIEPKEN